MKNLMKSHLTRGAWIEMAISATTRYCRFGRTSHEVRGLKYFCECILCRQKRRTSHEVRGLKLPRLLIETTPDSSHLTRGAWIEI